MAGIGGTQPELILTLDVEANPWADLMDKPVVEAVLTRVGGLPRGMQSGAASVFLNVVLPDGTQIIAETSWKLLWFASQALEAQYGAPR